MSLNTLNMRLNYRGGDADGRMNKDKLNSLKKAMSYSYQSHNINFLDENNNIDFQRTYRCLINPDKLKEDYNNMILSIPYENIFLGKEYEGEKGDKPFLMDSIVKPGNVFYWQEEDSYWIVYMHYINERAYFRAEIRKCEKEVTINDRTYKIYFRGPTETTIQWGQKSNTIWNNLNYSAIIFITKDENTEEYLKRFAILEIDGETWEVVARNPVSGDGIIEVALKETYTDTFPDVKPEEPEDNALIKGDNLVYPYDIKVYTVHTKNPSGTWYVSNKRAVIKEQNHVSATVEIVTGKSGTFDLIYRQEGQEDIVQPITIQSL